MDSYVEQLLDAIAYVWTWIRMVPHLILGLFALTIALLPIVSALGLIDVGSYEPLGVLNAVGIILDCVLLAMACSWIDEWAKHRRIQ
jgi:hypothetical protein